MTKDEALKLALAALFSYEDDYVDDGAGGLTSSFCYDKDEVNKAIAFIRKALAQPEQEPVAWINKHGDIDRGLDAILDPNGWTPLYITPPAAQQDWVYRERAVGYREGHQAALQQALAQSAQRSWVGLTDDELLDIADMAYANDLELLKNLQEKLKELNT